MELTFKIQASALAKSAGLKQAGADAEISKISILSKLENGSLFFVKKLSDETLNLINKVSSCLIVLPETTSESLDIKSLMKSNAIILSKNPRLDFARLLTVIEEEIESGFSKKVYTMRNNGSIIGEGVTVGTGVVIEPLAFVDHGVVIGKETIIRTGAKIRKRVKIGERVIIRENSVIGGPGFGMEKDESGNNYRIPQIGGVIIKDNVEVGALNTVASGTIEPTVLEEYVKTDDHVHVAHNCYVGAGSSLTACVEVSGSVVIGKNCMIGPNTSIMNGITIGNRVTVGLGAVVTKNVPDESVIAGSPAEPIEIIKAQRKAIKRLIE